MKSQLSSPKRTLSVIRVMQTVHKTLIQVFQSACTTHIGDDNTGILHVFELQIGRNEFDHHSFFIAALSNREKSLKNSGLSCCCLSSNKKIAMVKFIHLSVALFKQNLPLI